MSLKNNLFDPVYEYQRVSGVRYDFCSPNTTIPLYHLSSEPLTDGDKIKLKVPRSCASSEDNYIPRVCMSTSIEGALKAIYCSEGDDFFVYKYRLPIGSEMKKLLGNSNGHTEKTVVKPTMIGVMDGYITGEVWVMNSELIIGKDVVLCGKVHVISKIYHENVNDMYYINTGLMDDMRGNYEAPIGCSSYVGEAIPEIFYDYKPIDPIKRKHILKIEKDDNCLYFEEYIDDAALTNINRHGNDDPSLSNKSKINIVYSRHKRFLPDYVEQNDDTIEDVVSNTKLCQELILSIYRLKDKEKEAQVRNWWSLKLGLSIE